MSRQEPTFSLPVSGDLVWVSYCYLLTFSDRKSWWFVLLLWKLKLKRRSGSKVNSDSRLQWLNKRTDDDPRVCCGLGTVVSVGALASLWSPCVKLYRNSSFPVEGKGRSHGMAESEHRVFKQRQLISCTVCHRVEHIEREQPIHRYKTIVVFYTATHYFSLFGNNVLLWRLMSASYFFLW